MLRLDSEERSLLRELEPEELLEDVEEVDEVLLPLELRLLELLLLELLLPLELRLLELEELEEELLELVLLTDIGLSCGWAARAFPPGLIHRMPVAASWWP